MQIPKWSRAKLAVSQSLTQLETAQLVRRVDQLALTDAPEYMFKHVLVQEAAYESLLKQERGALHKRVAETIEQLDSDVKRLDANAAILAGTTRWQAFTRNRSNMRRGPAMQRATCMQIKKR
jgi:hypothetical protein